jgi:cytochrome c-type biogenesis protein
VTDPVGSAVLNGGLLVAIPLALVAGLASFLSPCILPLVPGYLGYVGGFADGTRAGRRRLLGGVGLFVLGFTIVFVALGVLFGTAGLLLRPWLDLITRIAGVLVILMGLVFIGVFGLMQRTVKPQLRVATGLVGAPLLGIVFALGWTPCVGPTLVALYSIVLDQGDPWRGGLLAVCYSLGLGLPFLALALGLGWVASGVKWVKRHLRAINIAGGILLIVIGVLMVSGLWQAMMSGLTAVINGFTPAL